MAFFLKLSYHMVSDDLEYNAQVNGLHLWSFYGVIVIFYSHSCPIENKMIIQWRLNHARISFHYHILKLRLVYKDTILLNELNMVP